MNKLVFTILLFCFTLLLKIDAQDPRWPVQEPAFKSGEKLIYALRYGPIHGGEAHIAIEAKRHQGKEVFHAVALAQTVGLVDKLYKVKDIYQSFFDPVTNLPYKAIRDIHEGNYKWYNEVTYNHADTSVMSQRSGKIKVPANSLDMVATLYYLRRIDYDNMKTGEIIMVNTYFADEIYPFEIRFSGRETITTDLGKFKCLRFDPVVEPGRVFESEDDMTIWITDDANHVPIRIEFDMVVGSVKVDLKTFKNLKHPLKTIVD